MTITENTNWHLSPDVDFIYNRFDKIYSCERVLLTVTMDNSSYQIPAHIDGKSAQFGLWMSQVPNKAVCNAAEYIFQTKRAVQTIEFTNYLQNITNYRGGGNTLFTKSLEYNAPRNTGRT